MSRSARFRALTGVAFAVTLIAGGVAAFAAGGPGCASWTDPKGDSSTDQDGVPGTEDSQLDIVSASFNTVGDTVVGTITTDGLSDSSSDMGDEFALQFTVAGVKMLMYVDRTATGGQTVDQTSGFYSSAGTGVVTAAFNVKTKTVTLTGKITELAKAAGKPVMGQEVSALTAITSDQFQEVVLFTYDDAPTTLKPVIGVECGGGSAAPAAAASPSASASPSATASASPSATASGSPSPAGTAPATSSGGSATCPTYTDPAGDAGPGNQPAANPVAGDDDLDLVAVTHSVAGDDFTTTFKVVKLLEGGPDFSFGDRFKASFTVAGKAVTVTAERDFSGFGTKKAAATVAGTAVTFPVTLIEDVKGSTIGASMSAAALEKAAGASLAGQPFSAMSATAGSIYPSNGAPNAALNWDLATAPATATYAFGTGCGGAGAATSATPTATLALSAPSRVQTGDVLRVGVTFTSADGKPVAGANVTGRLGSGPATTSTTNDAGRTTVLVQVTGAAAQRGLVISAPGAATAKRTITVLAERSLLNYAITGTGSSRLVSVTLTDDDAPTRHPYAGAAVTFAYSGKSVVTRTDSKGRASVRVKTGTKLDMTYAGRAGYITSAKRQTTAN